MKVPDLEDENLLPMSINTVEKGGKAANLPTR